MHSVETRPSGESAVSVIPLMISSRASRAWPSGRVCDETGCETFLSIYNETAYCCLHQRPEFELNLRGRRVSHLQQVGHPRRVG